MNYLAHIYLSGKDDPLKIGNFIADSVKGKKYLNYPEGIKNGILLHRKIDSFTDSHPTVKKSTSRLNSDYGLYSGVIVDMLYDHFLAANWKRYHPTPLKEYTLDFYALLKQNFEVLPVRVQKFYPYMVEHNWLLSYATIPGIKLILFQMNHRVKKDIKLHLAVEDLISHYDEFEMEFHSFFKELEAYVEQERNHIS